MPLSSPEEIVEIIQALLPGLIALASILMVVIVFLLEKFEITRYEQTKKAYRRLTWFMTSALVIGIIDIFLSLPIVLGIGDRICIQDLLVYFAVVLSFFILCLLLVVIGTFMVVRQILGPWFQRKR